MQKVYFEQTRVMIEKSRVIVNGIKTSPENRQKRLIFNAMRGSLDNKDEGDTLGTKQPPPQVLMELNQANPVGIIKLDWFCLFSQPKHEHIAAAHLRQIEGVEVYLPRIRFKRATKEKSRWATEALFPGYLFARFDWDTLSRQVKYARGVRGIVHFGDTRPAIPHEIIQELQRMIGTEELHTIDPVLAPGDAVHVVEGSLRGLQAVVSRVMPGRERVAVLMDMLGQPTVIELTSSSLIREKDERTSILQAKGHLPSPKAV